MVQMISFVMVTNRQLNQLRQGCPSPLRLTRRERNTSSGALQLTIQMEFTLDLLVQLFHLLIAVCHILHLKLLKNQDEPASFLIPSTSNKFFDSFGWYTNHLYRAVIAVIEEFPLNVYILHPNVEVAVPHRPTAPSIRHRPKTHLTLPFGSDVRLLFVLAKYKKTRS